jgi:hypothetical protein
MQGGQHLRRRLYRPVIRAGRWGMGGSGRRESKLARCQHRAGDTQWQRLSPAYLMNPVNLAALAAAEIELACLKMALAQGPRRTPAGPGRLAHGGRDALRHDKSLAQRLEAMAAAKNHPAGLAALSQLCSCSPAPVRAPAVAPSNALARGSTST